jgi:AGCS family alanine or glycine:cation symporter
MCSGIAPTAEIEGAPYVQMSMQATLGDFGPIFITVAMILFAFTTLLGNLYYVDQAWKYIFKRTPSKHFNYGYYILASLVIFVGAGLKSQMLWDIADITMGLMAIINIPVIIILSKYAFRALKDYKKQKKQGKNPVFHAKDIGLPHDVDYWQ